MDKVSPLIEYINESGETTARQQLFPQSSLSKYNSFMRNLSEMISKHKYRKALTEIKKNEEYNQNNPQSKEPLAIIKLQCYFLIIKKKFSKYPDITSTNISSWLKRIETELDLLSISFKAMRNDNEENFTFIEQFIFYELLYLYNYAIYSKRIQLINDAIGYLVIAENMIKSLGGYIIYPSTLHLIQLIYLLFSGILIEQGYFSTANKYITLVLTLGFKELELRSSQDSTQLKTTKDQMKDEDELLPYFHNIFFTFVVSFVQLGICAESIGNYDLASDSYEQSKWFISFISESTGEALITFINDLTIKSKQTLELLSLLKCTDFTSVDYTDCKIDNKKNLYYSSEEKIKRYQHIQNYVENLKLTEIDDDEANLLTEVGSKPPTDTVKKMTSTVNFINILMSNKYKPLVSSINKLEINNLNKETKTKIQKKIIDFKNTERVKQFELKSFASTTNSNNCFNSNPNITNSDSLRTKTQLKINPQLLTDTSLPTSNHRYNTNTYSHINTLSSFSSHKPERIKYDKYVFDKAYRSKINYLENQTKKEYLFQKDLLKMKSYDTVPLKAQESERVINNCEKFYKKTLNNCIQKIKENQEAVKLNNKSIEQDIKKTIMLSFKSKKKREEKIMLALSKNFPKIPKSRRTLEYMKQNQHMIDKLEYDIEVLGDRSKKIDQKQKSKEKKIR